MVKEKKILLYFISFLLGLLTTMIVGISNVFAATYYLDYNYLQQYYDNAGSTVTAVSTTWNESLQSYVSGNITTASGSYGAGLSITSPVPLIQNHTYTLSIYFVDKNNIAKSSKWGIGIGTSLANASSNYATNSYGAQTIQSTVNNNTILQFVFKANINGNYIFIPWTTTTTTTQSYVTTQIIMEDLGSEGVSIDEINSSLTNQTNELNTSIQESTNTITDTITDVEESINGTINDNFNDCDNQEKKFTKFKNGYLYTNGDIKENTSFYISNYINIQPNNNYSFDIIDNNNMNIQWGNYCLYNKDKVVISCHYLDSDGTSYSFTSTSDTYYFRTTLYNANNVINNAYISGNICTNKIDETNDKLDNIEDALTDSSPTDMSGLGDSAGWLPAGPVDSILNLPLTMLNNLVSNLSNNCQTISVELPFVKKNINLPCIKSLYDKMGVTGTLFKTAGLIASAFILYNYLLKLYKWVDDTLTMRENTMPGYFDDNWGGGA